MSEIRNEAADRNRRRLHAPLALLPQGWARDVLLEIDEDGNLTEVAQETAPDTAERLHGIVLPGIPNLHSHAFQRAMAGLAERPGLEAAAEPRSGGAPDTFWSWRDTLYRFLELLSPEDVEAVAAFLFIEMLRAGFTSVAEFHYLHLAPDGRPYADPAELSRRVIRAAETAGIGITHLPTLYRTGGFGRAAPAAGQRRFAFERETLVELLLDLAEEHRTSPNVEIGLAIHSLRAVPLDDLRWAVERVREVLPTAPVHIHVAEQVREVEECVAWSGLRPVELLLSAAEVDERWCLVHATHVSEEELEGIRASGAVVGLCPTTEANLGDGLFPLPSHLRNGGRIGIGSDSHVSVSPVEELRWLEYGQRLHRRERNVAGRFGGGSSGTVLLGSALEGGRVACGRRIGRLESGERADLVVLDREDPNFEGMRPEQLLDAWIFSGNRNAVRDVYVGGRAVIESGRHSHDNEITARYRERIRNVLSSF